MAKNLFNSVKLSKPKKSVFDLTHDVKMTGDMGNLIPSLVMECLPGDKFHLGCESLIRFAPLIAPVMHRMDVTMHYFFVPNRVLWPNWEKFITGDDSVVPPYIPYTTGGTSPAEEKFMDYMSVPPNSGTTAVNINALPFAAYQMIVNEYYRDENLMDEIPFTLVDGNNSSNSDLLVMRQRCWEHDYFTASLPFAQKGAAVDIPLGSVSGAAELKWNTVTAPSTVVSTSAGNITIDSEVVKTPADELLYAKLDDLDIEPTTINDLRVAIRLQEWLERNARGGTRYIENILAHFGVKSSDARLNRPEYITGVKTPVVISEVLNTTGEDGGLPQGNMAGHGISVSSGRSGSYYCEEHGFIIGIMSVMPKTAYQQGIPRQFLKTDYLDYGWPTFAHLGEQAVTNNEIFAYTATGNDVFGYVPRYAEYKFMPSRVAGDFRTTLNYWHLGRIFDTQPALNEDFVAANPTKRIFAVEDPDTDSLYMHVLHRITAVRCLPKYGTPQF